MTATNICANLASLVSLSFVGRLGEYELAVAMLATSLYNVSGLSLVFGFVSAMETFAG
jgi:MATE family multidrug resistance protein